MKPEEESENTAGSDCQERLVSRFDDIRSVLDDVQTHIQKREVDTMKGACWKGAVECLIEKYGIKDDTIPDKIAEYFRIALEQAGPPDETHAVIQDALVEFRSEYNRLISLG
jgi:hypothetical protein